MTFCRSQTLGLPQWTPLINRRVRIFTASYHETKVAPPPDILVQNLNDLLASLELPITVDSPYDLTPSLLLAILESILRDRLPISNTIRNSQTSAAKVEAMKVFLGILEDDVLQTDIGLSEIDPRRLAAGEWEEVTFVGETLCWLGHHQEQIHPTRVSLADHSEVFSSGDSRTNTSIDTGFSGCDASEMTATTVDHDPTAPILDSLNPVPRCIHEFDITSSSFDVQSTETELCDCSLGPYDAHEPEDTSHDYAPTPAVRYHGLIQPVQGDIEDFESWREYTRLRSESQIPRRVSIHL